MAQRVTLSAVLEQLNTRGAKQVHLDWTLGAENIVSLAEELIQHSRAVYDKIAATKAQPSWEATVAPATYDDIYFHVVQSICTFPQHVSADKAVRDASTQADEKLSAYQVEVSCRYDVFQAVQAFADTKPQLGPEESRYVEKCLRGFRRKGMHLDEATREKIKALNMRMKELEIKYQKHLGDENGKLYFTPAQLAGLPDDFLSSLEKREDGSLEVTLKYPHQIPVMKLCTVAETRRQMEAAFNSRCLADNTAILEELVTLRDSVAKILSYPTHADYVTEIRMAKKAEAVRTFLDGLSQRLTPLLDQEMAVLQKLKDEDCTAAGLPTEPVKAWDIPFYRNKVETKFYNVDHQFIKNYFPLEKVTAGLLQIYQELLGLTFVQVHGHPLWHPEALMYKVTNTADGKDVGYFYLDMHPREGKYGHAACWPLQPGCLLPNGERMLPVTALVCNFTKSTATQPSLLTHDEVETFFHEFGHGMHNICSLANLELFSGTNVEQDFVEAPSQMLENWAWEPAVLARLSAHVSDGAPLPEDVVQKLVASRNANCAIFNKRQLLLATFDQTIHTSAKADTAATLATLTRNICNFEMTPGTNMAASFGHMAGGYDAQYYGYLWSEVFSMDMFATHFKGRIFDPAAGALYRSKILAPGGSRDGAELLRDFLGRDPTPDAFLISKGLAV